MRIFLLSWSFSLAAYSLITFIKSIKRNGFIRNPSIPAATASSHLSASEQAEIPSYIHTNKGRERKNRSGFIKIKKGYKVKQITELRNMKEIEYKSNGRIFCHSKMNNNRDMTDNGKQTMILY